MRACIISLSFLSVLLLGCSGGGGGSDDGGISGNASTGVRVLNTSMDLPPVSVTTTAKVGQIISTTKFSEATGFFELPEGDQTISVQSVDGTTGPFNFSVSIKDQDRPQVLVYGTRETYGVFATFLEAKQPEIPDGFAAVRVANGVSGAAAVQGSIGVSEIPAQLSIGNVSKYLIVPAGPTLIRLTRSADSRILANQQALVESGKAYTFVISGEIDYLVVANLLQD